MSRDTPIELGPEETRRAIEADNATIVDVRTPDERTAGTIDGALQIGLDELTQRAAEIPRDRAVIFYCRSGSRSQMAAQAFRQAGYDAYSMAGGFEAWSGG